MSSSRTKRRKIAAEVSRIVANANFEAATDGTISCKPVMNDAEVNNDGHFLNANTAINLDMINCNSSDSDQLPENMSLIFGNSASGTVENDYFSNYVANVDLFECFEWVPRNICDDDDDNDELQDELSGWATQHNVSHSAVTGLLHILKKTRFRCPRRCKNTVTFKEKS
jgi:hypothetical protein